MVAHTSGTCLIGGYELGSAEAKELVGWAPSSLRSWEKMTIKEATVVWLTCRNLTLSKINDKQLNTYFKLFA